MRGAVIMIGFISCNNFQDYTHCNNEEFHVVTIKVAPHIGKMTVALCIVTILETPHDVTMTLTP